MSTLVLPGRLNWSTRLSRPSLPSACRSLPKWISVTIHSIRMPYEWSAPDESEVDKAIEDLRQMYSTTENVEREAQEGDYVLVDVKSEHWIS